MRSINQIAQEDGDTSANEANRIREREATVKRCWRTIAFEDGEEACSAESVAACAGLPVDYVRLICERYGYPLV